MGAQQRSVERHWSGGQYSLARMLLGVLSLSLVVRSVLAGSDQDPGGLAFTLLALAAVASLAMTIGWRDRWAGGMLVLLLVGGQWASPLLVVLLLSHLCQRPAPYLSLDARGRVDPGADWSHRSWTGWFIAAAAVITMGWWLVSSGTPAALGDPWTLLATLVVAWVFVVPPCGAPVPDEVQGQTYVFYDGHCGLCHGAVRWILAEDTGARPLALAPLQGSTFEALVDEETRAGLPDSLVVRRADAQLLLKSDGVLAILLGMGGHWRCLGRVLGLVPRALRDLAYDGVARVRRRVFGEPQDLCPLLPPSLAERFAP